MAEIHKLSVEKTLNKIRGDDAKQSKEAALNDKIGLLDEQIGRMRAQRQRLEHHQGKRRLLPHVIRSGSWYRAYSGFCTHKLCSSPEDEIAAKQAWLLKQHPPRGTKLRTTDVKELFDQMKDHAF